METEATTEFDNSSLVRQATEVDPLLGEVEDERAKPFYRPRPLWLVPFAVTAAVVRGMTLAPRIEVYTHLSCNAVQGHDRAPKSTVFSALEVQNVPAAFYAALDPLGPQLHPHQLLGKTYHNLTFSNVANSSGDTEEDPRRLPSTQCVGDPAVQAGAARLQTIMTTIMGFLSAITTGWWGRFSERHGRTRVLAICTFGLFMTDLIFILASTPSSPLSSHGHKLLLLAPIIEGVLGGWSTLQSATSAYLSDCTSSGSRAAIFSRFSGVFYVGLSVGPSLGGYLIKHPLWTRTEANGVLTVTSVFWVAIVSSFINFILVLFIFPESLDKVKRIRAAEQQRVESNAKGKGQPGDLEEEAGESSGQGVDIPIKKRRGLLRKFFRPLGVFRPALVSDGEGRKRKDWSLTMLGMVTFGYMLAQGVYQLKYLYAEHIYGWGAEQLSYYISFLGVTKALFLLLLLPWIISAFKPKPRQQLTASSTQTKQPSKAHLAREMSFDLVLTRISLSLELLSNALVVLAPLPSYEAHGSFASKESQALFVAATSLSSLGGGGSPAIQSLALSMLQLRTLSAENNDQLNGKRKAKGVGELFGALAVLQAMGQTIVGPLLFGLIYSGTVAKFPQAIFVTAAGILFCSFVLMMLIRAPTTRSVGATAIGRGNKGKKKQRERERGRSRVSKDLRSGAIRYGSTTGSSSSSIV